MISQRKIISLWTIFQICMFSCPYFHPTLAGINIEWLLYSSFCVLLNFVDCCRCVGSRGEGYPPGATECELWAVLLYCSRVQVLWKWGSQTMGISPSQNHSPSTDYCLPPDKSFRYLWCYLSSQRLSAFICWCLLVTCTSK